MSASGQWATRPDDQRFWDLPEMLAVLKDHQQNTTIVDLNLDELEMRPDDTNKEILLSGNGFEKVKTSHWAFGQLCQATKSPASFMRDLPADKAVELLEYRMQQLKDRQIEEDGDGDEKPYRPSQVILYRNGQHMAEGLTSQKYGRIYNADIVSRLMNLPGNWKVPPARPTFAVKSQDSVVLDDPRIWDPTHVRNWPLKQLRDRPRTRIATQRDIDGINPDGLGCPVSVGDVIAPAGLYGTHNEIFIFMVNPDCRLENEGLARGFILRNSELGSCSFTLSTFLFEGVCGNHCIFGLKNLTEVRVVHLGDKARDRAFDDLKPKLKAYSEQSIEVEESLLRRAASLELGTTKDEVVKVIANRVRDLSQRDLKSGYDTAEEYNGTMHKFSPRSVRGMVWGLTRYSQTKRYAEERHKIDAQMPKLFAMAE